MATINPYLNFPGNAEEAFTFYKSVFGGELMIVRYSDTPEASGNLSEEDKHKLMHVSLPIGKGNVLMATDVTASSKRPEVEPGNNFYLSIAADSEAEADTLFNALAKGGNVTMPIGKAFWNAYFGMLTDQFGVKWMVNYDYNH